MTVNLNTSNLAQNGDGRKYILNLDGGSVQIPCFIESLWSLDWAPTCMVINEFRLYYELKNGRDWIDSLVFVNAIRENGLLVTWLHSEDREEESNYFIKYEDWDKFMNFARFLAVETSLQKIDWRHEGF